MLYSNAGQDHPFLLRSNSEPIRLDKGGIPLAMMNEFSYEEGAVELQPGDLIVMYSDGITEAMNAAEEQFTEKRVLEVLRACQHESPEHVLEQLTKAAKQHAGSTPQSDDMTVVVIKRMQ